MKIVLTGACGGLGQAICRLYAEKDIELITFRHEEELNITDREMVAEKIGGLKNVDFVIHTAAFTNVDGAETDSDSAFAVNGEGTKNIALACQVNGAIVVYISTDYVFDGTKNSPYLENDRPNPINVYGHSKLAGEEHIKALLNQYYIVRTAWLFGAEGNNFARWLINRSEETNEISVVTNHVGSPTLTDDLALGLLQIMQSGNCGIYHFTNSGTTNWYDWASHILTLLGKSEINLRPTSWDKLNVLAPRPLNSVLDNSNWQKNNFPPSRSWQEATAAFLKQIS